MGPLAHPRRDLEADERASFAGGSDKIALRNANRRMGLEMKWMDEGVEETFVGFTHLGVARLPHRD
jgi:hypothetical protein